MRIPVFRTRAVATGEAPGRRIQARMRGDVLARAELQKGELGAELINQVGAYAKMRYETAEEAKLNEALLSAEEGIRTASRDLSRSSQLYNIFEGENLWDQQTSAIRDQALDALGANRFTRQKFLERYGQMELSSRFQLRGIVDRKMDAAAQAAIARREAGIVNDLSVTGFGNSDAMIAAYDEKVLGITVDKATGVKQGRYNASKVSASTNAMKVDIAKNVVSSYVSTSPLYAVSLAESLEVIDLLNAGIDVPADERPSLPGGAYVLHTLENIPRDDAMDIIKDALTEATAFQNARDKQREIIEKQDAELLASQSAELDELMLTIDPLKQYDVSDLEAGLGMFPGITVDTTQDKVAGYDILSSLRVWAFDNLDVTQQKNEFYLEQINGATRRPKVSNPIVHEVLTQKATLGNLTFEDVDLASVDLTLADQRTLFGLVRSQGDAGMTKARGKIKQALSYDANLIRETNAEDATRLLNEVNDLYSQLDDAYESAMQEGRPLSYNQIINLANDLIASAPGVRDIINESLRAVISDATYANAFPDIIAEVSNLPIDQQPAEIIRLLDKMLRETDNIAPKVKGASTSFRVELKRINDRYEALKR